MQPGQQESGADEGLQEQEPQISEAMFPTHVVGQGGMPGGMPGGMR